MVLTDSELAQILSDLKYLDTNELQAAQAQATASKQGLYETLVEHDYLNEEELSKVIAYHYQLPYVSLRSTNIADDLLRLIPKSVAERFQTIPFELDENGIHIATAHPEATDLYAMLAKKAGVKQYQISYSPEPEILAALHLYKPKLSKILTDILARSTGSTPPVNELIDKLFEYAYEARASDVHIEPQVEHTMIRFR